ncbi:MAG: cytochrome c [Burkholderiaceae bacterium]
MKQLLCTAAAAVALSLASLPVVAAEAAQDAMASAKEKAASLCASCHGADGKTPADPSYPIIAGQYADYLTVALKAYKSGQRKNPIMAGMVGALSTAELEALAKLYSAMPGPLSYKR